MSRPSDRAVRPPIRWALIAAAVTLVGLVVFAQATRSDGGTQSIAMRAQPAARRTADDLGAPQATGLPERVSIVDHSGMVVGTVSRDDLLAPLDADPGEDRSTRAAAVPVLAGDGTRVGFEVQCQGFVPLAEAEATFARYPTIKEACAALGEQRSGG